MPCTAFLKAVGTNVVPTGLEITRLSFGNLVQEYISMIGLRRNKADYNRNQLIRTRHSDGEGLSELALAFEISAQRVHQIVQFK